MYALQKLLYFYEVVEEAKMVIVIRIGYYRRNWEKILRFPL